MPDFCERIETSRLSLVLLGESNLTASLDASRVRCAEITGFQIPDDWFDERDFIQLRRDQCRSDPRYVPWSPRAIVLRASNEMIGHIGFHEPPDPERLRQYGPDAVEFGYTIYPAFRRRGYATEAVRGLMTWAANDAGIRTFVVSISPTNVPSQAIARRFGFTKVGEHIDDTDGQEEVFVLSTKTVQPSV